MGRIQGEADLLYLTTTGRRRGLPREIEIWFTRAGGRYYVIAEPGERGHWVQNLRVEPWVCVRVGHENLGAVARVVDPAAESDLHAAVQAQWRGKYDWGDGLIVDLAPIPG